MIGHPGFFGIIENNEFSAGYILFYDIDPYDMNSSPVAKLKENEDEIRGDFGVKRIGIFGSFARGEEKPDSDIDIFVEFLPGKKTFDNYMGLKNFLEDLFERKVDLVTYEGLNPHIRENVARGVVYVT